MREWDPIGVAGVPEAADEYDRYGAQAYVMLMDERANAVRIAAYLLEVATKRMAMPHTARLVDRCNRAASALVALRPEFETH
jgi:hypothetical protein